MKFQNCILINFVMNAQTNGHTDERKAICPFNFSIVWGIKNKGARVATTFLRL